MVPPRKVVRYVATMPTNLVMAREIVGEEELLPAMKNHAAVKIFHAVMKNIHVVAMTAKKKPLKKSNKKIPTTSSALIRGRNASREWPMPLLSRNVAVAVLPEWRVAALMTGANFSKDITSS